MKAAVVGPTGRMIDLTDVMEPDPKPRAALVQGPAFSSSRGETYLSQRPRSGWRPGTDIAGTLTEQAANSNGSRLGQRVVGHPHQEGWAERVAIPTDRQVVVPDTVDLTVAAALSPTGLTGPMPPAGSRIDCHPSSALDRRLARGRPLLR